MSGSLPEPTRLGEVVWLEPYPETLLDGAVDVPLGPEARYERNEVPEPPPVPDSPGERVLVARFVRAFESGDVDTLVGLLTEDVTILMPPIPIEYQGRDVVARFLAAVITPGGYDLVPTRANGQPAFGMYLRTPGTAIRHGAGLEVLTLTGGRIRAITRFDRAVLPSFGLPHSL